MYNIASKKLTFEWNFKLHWWRVHHSTNLLTLTLLLVFVAVCFYVCTSSCRSERLKTKSSFPTDQASGLCHYPSTYTHCAPLGTPNITDTHTRIRTHKHLQPQPQPQLQLQRHAGPPPPTSEPQPPPHGFLLATRVLFFPPQGRRRSLRPSGTPARGNCTADT